MKSKIGFALTIASIFTAISAVVGVGTAFVLRDDAIILKNLFIILIILAIGFIVLFSYTLKEVWKDPRY